MATDKLAEALRSFTAWFTANYPGPDTIISDPTWHAPRIFRAARYAIVAYNAEAAPAEPVAWRCTWPRWSQYHDDENPLPKKWDDPPDQILPLYTHPSVQAQDARDARDAWQPIETLSGAPDLVLAYVPPDEQFPTGRMMIWRRDILTRNVAGPTPDHLMYPATHWMPLPKPPAIARGASDA